MSNVKDFILNVRNELASSAAEASCYAQHWGDKFVREQIQEVWQDTSHGLRRPKDRRITPNELFAMLPEELHECGFRLWSDEGGERLYLIPLYIYNYIANGTELKSIDGDVKVKGHNEIDLDVRMGCLAWASFTLPQPNRTPGVQGRRLKMSEKQRWAWREGDVLWVCPCCGAECNADMVGEACPAYGCEIEESE